MGKSAVGNRGVRARLRPSNALCLCCKCDLFRLQTIELTRTQPITAEQAPAARQSVATSPSNLHLLIPASSPDLDLCRTLVSAAILGYPPPLLVGWEQTPDPEKRDEPTSSIVGTWNYIRTLDESHDDDVVIIVNGDNAWMQLRPATLVDRFFDVNRKANARIQERLPKVLRRHDLKQQIIFGVQKECPEALREDPGCYAAPASELLPHAYGPNTDSKGRSEDERLAHSRPRFMDSGLIVGTVRALRTLFSQAVILRTMTEDMHVTMNHLFGLQLVYRETLRRDAGMKSNPAFTAADIKLMRSYIEKRPNGAFDFGIGLDYGSELGMNTAWADKESDTIFFDNPSSLQNARDLHGVSVFTGGLQIAWDIANSLPPFWTFSREPKLPRWDHWDQIPLFTNLWTTNAPAIIHHSPTSDESAVTKQSGWDKAWHRERARTLLDVQVYEPMLPMAVAGDNSSTIREFWQMELWKGGARDANFKQSGFDGWVRMDEACFDYHEQLFTDGEGPWVLPENH